MFRSVVAVLFGYVTMAVVLMVLFVVWFPDPGDTAGGAPGAVFTAVSGGYGFVAAFVGGWVSLLVARRQPVQHALALVAVAVIVWLLSVVRGEGSGSYGYQAMNLVATAAGVLAAGMVWAYLVRRFEARMAR